MIREVLESDTNGRPTVIVYRLTEPEREAQRLQKRQRDERARKVRESLRGDTKDA